MIRRSNHAGKKPLIHGRMLHEYGVPFGGIQARHFPSPPFGQFDPPIIACHGSGISLIRIKESLSPGVIALNSSFVGA